MEKRYQVFVSSTYTDLQEERLKVMQTLMRLDCIPAGMELFPAIDTEQFEYIKRIIDDSDYYILIIGGRYGSLSEDGISYTEKEYDYAVSKKIPVMAFLHEDISKLTIEKSDIDQEKRDKLIAFRDKVSKNRLIEYWSNANDLSSKVVLSLVSTIKLYPAIGWVRANLQSNTESLQEINTLRKELENLKNDKIKIEQKLNYKVQDIADLDEEIIIHGNVLEETEDGDYAIINKWSRLFSWSEIFISIAPNFLEAKVDRRAKDEIGDILYDLTDPTSDFYGDISDKSFNTIKIQFMALGLINIADKSGVYWRLSEKGIQKMLELGAVKTVKR